MTMGPPRTRLRNMADNDPTDPLHGITLKVMLEELVERLGWDGLGERIELRCFANDPSLSSSLKFLRKTAWARAKVEKLYLAERQIIERNAKRNRRRADQRAYRAEQESAATGPSEAGPQAPAPDSTGPGEQPGE